MLAFILILDNNVFIGSVDVPLYSYILLDDTKTFFEMSSVYYTLDISKIHAYDYN